MRAAVLRAFSDPLDICEVPEPRRAPDEVVVRVRAAGICGTDLKLWSGAFAQTTPLPIIPGHEIAGDLTEAVEGLPAGTRVACYFYLTCATCPLCRAGRTTLCPNAVRLGLERDGGMAEYVAVPRTHVLPFSDGLPYEAAAVAMDAVTAPWGALHGAAAVQAGEKVVVVGAGGLGLNAVQIARLAGARVAAVDPVAEHRELALTLGAELAVAPAQASQVRAWADGGVDLALEMAGARPAFATAVDCVGRGGRVVCCGYRPGLEYGLDSARLALEELQIRGSRSASRDQARAALEAVEAGHIKPQIMDRLPLEQVNDALASLQAGQVSGRLVLEV